MNLFSLSEKNLCPTRRASSRVQPRTISPRPRRTEEIPPSSRRGDGNAQMTDTDARAVVHNPGTYKRRHDTIPSKASRRRRTPGVKPKGATTTRQISRPRLVLGGGAQNLRSSTFLNTEEDACGMDCPVSRGVVCGLFPWLVSVVGWF